MTLEETTKKERKKKKKERKEKKDKENKGGKRISDKDKENGDGKKVVPFQDGKQRKQRKSVTFSDSYPFNPAFKDECVGDAIRLMFEGLEVHIKDLAIYPRVVAHAISKTVAQMIQILCYNNMKWMHTWKDLENRAHDEWEWMPEVHLPPIDTWARAIIPLKLSSTPTVLLKPIRSSEGQFQMSASPKVFSHNDEDFVPRMLRRASDTSLIKKMEKYNHYILSDKKKTYRRATDSPNTIEIRRKKMLEGVRRRLSAYIQDQAMLFKILREKYLIERPRSDPEIEYNHKTAFFDTFYQNI